MKKIFAVSILFLMLTVSCSVSGPGIPSPIPVLGTPQTTAIPTKADIGDGGLLTDLPCASPCVFGVRIGETQLDQVAPLLEGNNISPCEREDSVSWILIGCGGSVSVQMDAQTKVVNGIWFYPSVSISVDDLVEKYGEPDFVTVDLEGPPTEPTIQMTLYWDSISMLVELPILDGNVYPVERATHVGGITFLDDELYFGSSELQFGEFYKPWNGYGTYQP